ncbi:hypothetical protein D9757_007706 [Collybiopsis confluens]|uniref:Dihydrodipicolinate synthase n=1 Tax=Collybiopsis confluens TaxID=2823264 RepID=A0A8H5M1C3_9AGAR|nr:hypothetical protein D9757_007706 [Collybiopsis confluens]
MAPGVVRDFETGILAHVVPSTLIYGARGVCVSVFDTSGTQPQQKLKQAETVVGNLKVLKIPDLTDDEIWEASAILSPVHKLGREGAISYAHAAVGRLIVATQVPVGSVASPGHTLLCMIYPSLWSSQMSVQRVPRRATASSIPLLALALVIAIISNRSTVDLTHALSQPSMPQTEVTETLYQVFTLLDRNVPAEFTLQLGLIIESYRFRALRLSSAQEKQRADAIWRTAHDMASVVFSNAIFSDCMNGDEYQMGLLEKLVKKCILSSDFQDPEPSSNDLHAPLFLHLVHPRALQNLQTALTHVKQLGSYLASMTPRTENAQLSREVLLNLVECSGIDLEGLDSILDKLAKSVRAFDVVRSLTLGWPDDESRRALAAFEPSSAMQIPLREVVNTMAQTPALNKALLFVKSFEMADGEPNMLLGPPKDKMRDVVSKGILLNRNLMGSMTCLRCGGQTEYGKDTKVSRPVHLWEKSWARKCQLCGTAIAVLFGSTPALSHSTHTRLEIIISLSVRRVTTMPKVTVPPLPTSCLFGMIKPSGPTSMSLLNDLQPLLSKSRLFAQPAPEDTAPKHKKKRSKKVGSVKLGQGGTLDPLADGVLGLSSKGTWGGEGYKAAHPISRLHQSTCQTATSRRVPEQLDIRNIPRPAFWAAKQIVMIAKAPVLEQHRGSMSPKRWLIKRYQNFEEKYNRHPPSLKMDGKPLYEYARNGIPLPRPIEARAVTVHSLELVEWKGSDHSFSWPEKTLSDDQRKAMETAIRGVDKTATIEDDPETAAEDNTPAAFVIKMRVSGGTYVRSLVHDLAHELGSAGHVVTLTRSRQGRFAFEQTEDRDRSCIPWSTFERALSDPGAADEEGWTEWEREVVRHMEVIYRSGPVRRKRSSDLGISGPAATRPFDKSEATEAAGTIYPTMSPLTNGVSNGQISRPLKPGILTPIPTFFLRDSEDLARTATAGVGPLISGSMGEALHLSHSERSTLIRTARKTLDDIGLSHVPLLVGTGAGSTRESVELCKEAAEAGADYAIAIISGYFAGVLAGNRAALKAYWAEISEKSPIPVMIYNYPGASAGIDLDSDLISELAIECPNICGVKLTCGNVGKLTRIADLVSSADFTSKYPRKNKNAPFLVLGGYVDFVTPSTYANGHGAITGLANIAPYAAVKLFEVSVASRSDLNLLTEAIRLQGILARADFTISKASISGTKYLLQKLYGYGGLPRKPLPPISSKAGEALWEHPHTQDLIKLERELSGKAEA